MKLNKNNIKGLQDNIRAFKCYPDLVNFKQLKEMLGIGKNTAYELLMSGKIKHIKIGRNYRVYKKVKKNKVDKCNICGEVDQLTWEHVPPKSCGNSYHINTKNIFNTEKYNNLNLDSQNGVKYRTICANCNTNILGANADLQLKQLYEDVKAFIENVKNTNNIGKSSVNLVQLIKCVFGKFLAIDKAYSKDKISESMRKFVLKN